jgi:hypothetical protein
MIIVVIYRASSIFSIYKDILTLWESVCWYESSRKKSGCAIVPCGCGTNWVVAYAYIALAKSQLNWRIISSEFNNVDHYDKS